MTNELRELDKRCAFVMGDEFKTEDSLFDGYPLEMRHYSSDPAAARLLEDEIERRGLQDSYSETLAKMTGKPSEIGRFDDRYKDAWRVDWWGLIRATPEQRARAFLAVMEQH